MEARGVIRFESSLREWREALSSWRDNPIAARLALAARRREEQAPWWKRYGGLLPLFAVLVLASAACFVVVWVSLPSLGRDPLLNGNFIRGYIPHLAYLDLILGLFGSLCWLLGRLYTVAAQSLAFLSEEGERARGEGVDELLKLSRLSSAELLLGLGIHNLRLISAPLILCCALGWTGLAHYWPSPELAGYGTGMGGLRSQILAATCLMLFTLLHGLLSTLLLSFLLCGLGRARRQGFAPYLGAVMVLAFQFSVFLAVAVFGDCGLGYEYGGYEALELYTFVPSLLAGCCCFVVLYCFLLFAQANENVRKCMTYGFALWPCLIPMLVMLVLFAISDFFWENSGSFQGIATGYSVFSLVDGFMAIRHLEALDYGNYNSFTYNLFEQAARYFESLLMLALGLIVCGDFGAEAVSRFRRSAR
jgi:hypothetical protein